MRVAITEGWGNLSRTVRESSADGEDGANRWIRDCAPDPSRMAPWSTSTYVAGGTVVDYGSHVYFGFIFNGSGNRKGNEMKKETRKARPAAGKSPRPTFAKTISKPQTVDVSKLRVDSVTLTDNGRVIVRYSKPGGAK